jgi:DNA-binding LacI/PurR family transcriptional regulator
MVTMQDVARRAGVSVMTVSNVVNGQPHVREATRAKVLEAISELGYHVNTAARSLRQGRTGVIVLAVPEVDRPYFGLLATLLIERAAARGYDLLLEQTAARRDRELDAISRSRLRSYDGLILSAVQLHDDDAGLLRGDFPIVLLGERSYTQPLDHVVMANEEGAALATRHLLERGSRLIAMLGGRVGAPDDIDAGTLRARGYLAALAGAELPVDERLVRPAALTYEGGHRAAHELLDEHGGIDGLFCATDLVAVGAVRALTDRGLRVPDDVRVVGFDDVPLASFLTPSLTSIAPDHEAMADAVISMIVDRIEGARPADDYRVFTAPVRLVERESSRG